MALTSAVLEYFLFLTLSWLHLLLIPEVDLTMAQGIWTQFAFLVVMKAFIFPVVFTAVWLVPTTGPQEGTEIYLSVLSSSYCCGFEVSFKVGQFS